VEISHSAILLTLNLLN